jgi:hypothetical protein
MHYLIQDGLSGLMDMRVKTLRRTWPMQWTLLGKNPPLRPISSLPPPNWFAESGNEPPQSGLTKMRLLGSNLLEADIRPKLTLFWIRTRSPTINDS